MTGGRVFRILFVVVACVSLLANAVFVGIGARLLERGAIGGGAMQALAEMPREMRQGYVASLRAERPELQRLRAELQDRRREMLRIAGTPPVDAGALSDAMAEVRAATTRLQSAAHSTILESLEAAPSE